MIRFDRNGVVLCCAALFVLSFTARSQDGAQTPLAAPSIPPDIIGNAAFERLLDEESENEEGLSELLERFDGWLRRPVVLERAALRDIAALPFLSREEARALHAIARDPALKQDADEARRRIDSLLGGDRDRLALLHACTRLREHEDITPGYAAALRMRLQQEDEPRAGFLDGRYPGSRVRLQQRLRFDVGTRFSAGVLTEKDPGETALADQLAGHAVLRDLGVLRKAVVGDFAVTAGQGLVFWQQFGLSKGGEATRVGRAPELLSPYSSATEGFGARGAAVHLGGDNADFLIFYSSRGRDASIDAETGTAGAFGIDGLHRSASELARRGSVREQMAGAHGELRFPLGGGMLQLGSSLQGARYSVPSEPRTPFGFRGDEAWVSGADASWASDRLLLFGEAALAFTHVPAFIAGLEARLTSKADIAVVARRYHERFVSLQGSAFGERGEAANEEGAYIGLRLRPAARLKLNAWMDIYRFPNRTYFVHLPSSGVEGMCTAEYALDRATQLRLRASHVRKDQTAAVKDDAGRELRPIVRRLQHTFRMELSHETAGGTRLRLRAEYARTAFAPTPWHAQLPAGDGLLLSADLRLRPLPGFTLLGRLTAYGTDSYDARLYQFEHDVRGVMQNVVMYGDGLRAYLLALWRPFHQLELGLRYAVTIQDGTRAMSSGADTVEGDRLGKVSAQLDVEF